MPHRTTTCVQRSSARVDMCVWVGLEMTNVIFCVGSQLGSCSIINQTIETLTLSCPLGEVPDSSLEESLTEP